MFQRGPTRAGPLQAWWLYTVPAAVLFVLVAVLVVHLYLGDTFSFAVPKGKTGGFMDITSAVHLEHIDGFIGAFCDYNLDNYVDLVIVASNMSVAQVLFWSHEKYAFLPSGVTTHQLDRHQRIASVACSDFNADGAVDLLIVTRNSRKPSGGYSAFVYSHNLEVFYPVETTLGNTFRNPPHVVDWNGDSIPDLLLLPSSGSSSLVIALSEPSHKGFSFQFQQTALPPAMALGPTALLDLDGDCTPDLLVGALPNGLHMRSANAAPHLPEGGWRRLGLPPLYSALPATSFGPPAFADVDGDGYTDIIVAVCHPPATCATSEVLILYSGGPRPCRLFFNAEECIKPTSACEAAHQVELGLTDHSHVVAVPLHDVFAPCWGDLGLFSLQLHFGDVDMDGYPDLLVPVRSREGLHTRRFVLLLRSVPCAVDTCAAEAAAAQRRTFEPDRSQVELSEVPYAFAGAFADIDDDGTLDVVLLQTPAAHAGGGEGGPRVAPGGQHAWASADNPPHDSSEDSVLSHRRQEGSSEDLANARQVEEVETSQSRNTPGTVSVQPPQEVFGVRVLLNQIPHDSLFLKVTARAAGVGTRGGAVGNEGAPLPGTVFRFFAVDSSSNTRMHVGTQCPQLGLSPLQTPYVTFGLSRGVSYIDDFYMGVPHAPDIPFHVLPSGSPVNDTRSASNTPPPHTPPRFLHRRGLPPNSQMVGVPHPQRPPEAWALHLTLNPAGYTPLVASALAAALCILGVAVLVLDRLEKREDAREKRAQAHLFSFDTL